MKQATVKLPSGEYVLAEIAGWDKYHNPIYDNILFPGSWQLLGADPTNLTEVEAGEIVRSRFIPKHGVDGWPGTRYYWHFYYDSDIQKQICRHVTALASLDSLAASLGISKPYCVLKNVEK